MERIDDELLLAELRKRLEENRIALTNLRTMTQNLESLNEKLRQSESLKSDFLSNIRNEINNPLSAIVGVAQSIADQSADRQCSQTGARCQPELILDQAHRVMQITRQISDFSGARDRAAVGR